MGWGCVSPSEARMLTASAVCTEAGARYPVSQPCTQLARRPASRCSPSAEPTCGGGHGREGGGVAAQRLHLTSLGVYY